MKMPFLGVIGVMLATAAWAQGDLSQKVSYRHPAAPVHILLEELGKQTGVPLGAAANLNNEILIIRVQDVPLKDVLDKIALASAGEWTQEGGKTYLVRSSSRMAAENKTELEIRTAAVRKALVEKFKVAPPMSADDVEKVLKQKAQLEKHNQDGSFDRSAWEQIQSIDHLSPGFRCLQRIVQALDPRAVAALKDGDRIVYSSAPTPKQIALPIQAATVLSELQKEAATWNAAASRMPADDTRPEFYSDQDPHKFDKPFENPPAKVLLAVQSSGDGLGGGIGCALIVADAQGKILFTANDSISIADAGDIERQAREADKNSQSPKLELSAETRELGGYFGKMFGRQGTATRIEISDEWKKRILHPERYEPLSTSMSDIVLSICDGKNLNVVASIPDIFFIASIVLVGQPELQIQTVDGALAALRAFRAADFIEKDGWFDIVPNRPATTREQRANRQSVSDYLMAADHDGRVTLENRAHYALSQRNTGMLDLGTVLSMILSPEEARMMDGSMKQRLWLQLFGSLSAQQRQALAAPDGRISIGNMTAEQARILNRIVYGSKDAFGVSSGLTVIGSNGEEAESPNMYGPNGHTLLLEPTESLPTGLPRDGYLTMSNRSRDVIFAYAQGQPGYGSPRELSNLAWDLATRERPDLFPWATQQPAYDRFLLGTSEDYTMTVWLGSRLRTSVQLSDQAVITKGEPKPLDQMPEDFQKKLKEQIEKQRESFKNYQPSNFGGKQKPPPPHE